MWNMSEMPLQAGDEAHHSVSQQSRMPPTTEWWVVKKHLDILQQRVQLLLPLTEYDKQVHSLFAWIFLA